MEREEEMLHLLLCQFEKARTTLSSISFLPRIYALRLLLVSHFLARCAL